MKTTKRADLNRQFQQLQHTVEQRSTQEANAVERNKQYLAKNRANADIPDDENRPQLYLGLESGSSDYINAVYIHNVGIYYPAENMQALKKGSFEISSSRETMKPNYAMRSLKIRHTSATGDQFVFCHESVLEYLRGFDKDLYANFAGSNQ
ncbi:hypothetical protein MAR_031517 [Mya arenaria]|uniref:Uncharacterized protein n=1 Tax=Mya arenaria TaxID=6604 RepID=A0ABY7F404_MYAAR|nr:hypothetical protein MAR_031517 [Mya arenaria]